jgi:hypothetical protein
MGYGGWTGVHTGFRTITFHMITLVLYIGSLPNLATWFPCGRGRTLFILGSLGQRSRSPLLYIEFLTTGSFPHDNFSSVYWIFTKLGHMIPLWKGKNPIYFGVIRSKIKITVTINRISDNRIVCLTELPLYRLIIYIDRCILWCTHFLFYMLRWYLDLYICK